MRRPDLSYQPALDRAQTIMDGFAFPLAFAGAIGFVHRFYAESPPDMPRAKPMHSRLIEAIEPGEVLQRRRATNVLLDTQEARYSDTTIRC